MMRCLPSILGGLILLASLASSASNASSSIVPRQRSRVAVCFAGAVRALSEDKVQTAIRSFYKDADLFYHLYVGVELSMRGQRAVLDPHALTAALTHATGVRLQYTENHFSCGQQSTGKFYKNAQCARLVLGYAALHEVNYDAFVLTRPDYFIGNPRDKLPNKYSTLSGILTIVEGRSSFFRDFKHEVLLVSYPDGARLAANMTQAKCCDSKIRVPEGCFIDGLVEPRANFIASQHFSVLDTCGECIEEGLGRLSRTAEYSTETAGRSFAQLHSLIKPGVSIFKEPALSPPFLDWQLLELELQAHLVAHYIRAAAAAAAAAQESRLT